MEKIKLSASTRKVFGRKLKNLRKEGILPANVFGKGIKSLALSVNLKEFLGVFKDAGETNLIYLDIAGDKGKEDRAALVSNLQVDPVSDAPLHVDFHQVNLKEKVNADIPVELLGESPAEKTGIGIVVLYINEIEVEALPADLPDKFSVDISGLSEVDQAIYVKDLKADKDKVEIKNDPEAILVKVEPPQKAEEAPAPAPAEGEVPVEGEGAPGAAPVEGEVEVSKAGESREQKKE